MSAGPPLPADLWDSLPREARDLILALRAEAAELPATVRALQQQVNELQGRLNQNSNGRCHLSSGPGSSRFGPALTLHQSARRRRAPAPIPAHERAGTPVGHTARTPAQWGQGVSQPMMP